MSNANTLLREQSFRVKLLFLHIINAKEQVSGQSVIGLKGKFRSPCAVHQKQSLRLIGSVQLKSGFGPGWFFRIRVLPGVTGNWRRSAKEDECPRWAKALGCVRSAKWGTAGRRYRSRNHR